MDRLNYTAIMGGTRMELKFFTSKHIHLLELGMHNSYQTDNKKFNSYLSNITNDKMFCCVNGFFFVFVLFFEHLCSCMGPARSSRGVSIIGENIFLTANK